MPDTPARYVIETLRMTAGMLIWAVHLGFVYGLVGLSCARGHPGAAVVTVAIGITTVAALAGAAAAFACALRALRRAPDDAFRSGVAATVAGAAMVAIAWDGLPMLFLPACPP